MQRFLPFLVVVSAASALAEEANLPVVSGRGGSGFHLSQCLVSLIDDVEIPAEKAGVVTQLAIKEGDYVEARGPIATIDAVASELQVEAARAEHATVEAQAQNTLDVEHGVVTQQLADFKHRRQRQLFDQKAASDLEVETTRTEAEQARVKVGVAEFERRIHGLKSRELDAKARLAEADLARHQITAPLPGEVVDVFLRAGEWVEPGKPIARLVRLDRLRVEGFVRFDEHAPADVLGRTVTATIVTADAQAESFTGRVTFVSPIVQPGGEYRIWAEVENRRAGSRWLLLPGLEAEMVVQ